MAVVTDNIEERGDGASFGEFPRRELMLIATAFFAADVLEGIGQAMIGDRLYPRRSHPGQCQFPPLEAATPAINAGALYKASGRCNALRSSRGEIERREYRPSAAILR